MALSSEQVKLILSAQDNTKGAFASAGKGLDRLTKASRQLKAALTGIASGLAAREMAQFIRQQIDAGDAIAKTSAKVGVAAEMLQEMRYAAELSGVQANTLDMALQRFSRRVGEAAQGTGELKSTLEQYNIAVRDSDGSMRSVDAVLADLADTIQGAESDQERLRIAFKAFDSEGAALVNTLADGSAGLEKMRAEARELGVVLSRDDLAAMEEINDQFDRFSAAIQGVVNGVMVQLLPDLENMSGYMFAAAKNSAEMDKAGKFLSSTLKLLMSGAVLTGAAFKVAGANVVAFADAATFIAEGELAKALDVVKTRVSDMSSEMKEAHQILLDIWGNKPGPEIVGTDFIPTEATPKVKELTDAVVDLNNTGKATTGDLERTVERQFDNMGDTIAEFVTTGKMNFKDFANSVISDLVRLAVQQSIVQPLMSAASGWFGGTSSAASGLMGGTNGTPYAGELSAYFSANAKGNVFSGPGISAYSGQIVNKPTVFPFANGIGLMGEAGAEAILPLTRIGGKLGVQAKGGGTNVIINNYGDTEATVTESRTSSGADIVVTLEKSMADRIQGRGSRLSKTLESVYGLRRNGGR